MQVGLVERVGSLLPLHEVDRDHQVITPVPSGTSQIGVVVLQCDHVCSSCLVAATVRVVDMGGSPGCRRLLWAKGFESDLETGVLIGAEFSCLQKTH